MTREHKILAGVLAVGCLALGADRLVFSGETAPQTAAAEVPAAVQPATDPAGPAQTTQALETLATEQPAGPSIASQLVAAENRPSDKTERRDAFSANKAWFGSAENASTPSDQAIKTFLSQHTLNAVMNGRLAIINGETYEVGASLVDFQLVALNKEGAIFQYAGQHVTLRLYKEVPSKNLRGR